jgi:hypothetical protein
MDTPAVIRKRIIDKYQAHVPQIIISQQLAIPKSTVCDIIKKFKATNDFHSDHRNCGGQNKIFTLRDERSLCRASQKNPRASARELGQAVGGPAATASIWTIQRSLRRSGRKCYRPSKAPSLSKVAMKTRLSWAKKHEKWSVEQWKRVRNLNSIPLVRFCFVLHILFFLHIIQVIFSDESCFDVTPARSQIVRRSTREQITTAHIAQHRPFQVKTMFWGCMCHTGPGPLIPVIGTMRQANYLATLQEHLLPKVTEWFGSDQCIYQQDNAPCHKAASVRNFLQQQTFEVMEWPPYSPDLSPIENLWAIVKRRVHSSTINNKQQLQDRVLDVWNNDPLIRDSCKSLIEGMPRRVRACIAARGAYTKY